MKDTETAFLDFLKETKNDSIKTLVYGMSLGGQLAIKLTKDNQKQVDGLVLDGSLESAYSFITDNFQEFYLQSFIKNPEEYNQDYIALRDIVKIDNTPKLIIQSNRDRAVPLERGINLFNSAKGPKTFWETSTEHTKTIRDLPDETVLKLNEIIDLQR